MKNLRVPLIGKVPSTLPVMRWVPPDPKRKKPAATPEDSAHRHEPGVA